MFRNYIQNMFIPTPKPIRFSSKSYLVKPIDANNSAANCDRLPDRQVMIIGSPNAGFVRPNKRLNSSGRVFSEKIVSMAFPTIV